MKYPAEILTGKIVNEGESGDGKAMFLISSTNNGWQDLRIEIDTNDCDSDFAEQWAARIMECVNSCRGLTSAQIKTFISESRSK